MKDTILIGAGNTIGNGLRLPNDVHTCSETIPDIDIKCHDDKLADTFLDRVSESYPDLKFMIKNFRKTSAETKTEVEKNRQERADMEQKLSQLSNNEIRNLKRRGWIIVPAAFMYPQMVGQPDFHGSARVKVFKEQFTNLK